MKYSLMENKEQQILSEIKSMMASIRSQLELLDAKMAELQQTVSPETSDSAPIDLEIDIEAFTSESPVMEDLQIPLDDVEPDDDLPFDDVGPEPADEVLMPADEPIAPEDLPEPEEELLSGPEDDLPLLSEPEPVPVVEEDKRPLNDVAEVPTAVIDMMAEHQAWRTDMPGSQVKDIRSAISLNDRIIFINYLFNEDPMLFQETLNKINQMSSFDEAVAFAATEHPEWDFDSEVIYRFMMAVRRRLR